MNELATNPDSRYNILDNRNWPDVIEDYTVSVTHPENMSDYGIDEHTAGIVLEAVGSQIDSNPAGAIDFLKHCAESEFPDTVELGAMLALNNMFGSQSLGSDAAVLLRRILEKPDDRRDDLRITVIRKLSEATRSGNFLPHGLGRNATFRRPGHEVLSLILESLAVGLETETVAQTDFQKND